MGTGWVNREERGGGLRGVHGEPLLLLARLLPTQHKEDPQGLKGADGDVGL